MWPFRGVVPCSRSLAINTPTQPKPLSNRDQRRNFILGVVNGATFWVANVFIDNDMVVTWFLAQLAVSNFVIGLMGPMRMVIWYIPQIVVSSYLQRQPYKLPLYRVIAFIRTGVIFLLGVVVAVIPPSSPWMVATVFTIFAIYSLGTSVGALTFMSMIDAVIPQNQRGAFFAQRRFWGGLINLGAGALVGILIESPAVQFPVNFAIIFGIAAVAMGISFAAWSLLKEPYDHAAIVERIPWWAQVRRGTQQLRDNAHYRTYVAVGFAFVLAQVAMPFYIVYAKDVLGISARMISVYITARTMAGIISNFYWGGIGDREGHRKVIRMATVIGLVMPVTALLSGLLARTAPEMTAALSYIFTLVFIASGMFSNATGISTLNYLLELAPPSMKPLYIGFTNTVMGVGMFTTALGGLIVDWAGFDAVMVISACCYVAAAGLSLLLIEPRQQTQTAG